MKISNGLVWGTAIAASLLLAACSDKASVKGVLEGVADGEIVVNYLDVNKLKAVDTLRADASGAFSCKLDIPGNEPAFFYLHRGETRIAPLLLSAGDKVVVTADTLGGFDVKGAPDAELYCSVEKDYAAFAARMDSLAASGNNAALSKEYVSYYRDRVKFVMENPFSLAVIPVFYQTVGDGLPVFGQATDGIHFKNICDSLSVKYPGSRYVSALEKTARQRNGALALSSFAQTAREIEYPDIELPDMDANKVKLSGLDAKVVLVYFWSPSVDVQKMYNLDVLVPVYREFHAKGFEIYQIALEVDKASWASVMKNQKLPWINVCDVNEGASRYASTYNVTSTPSAFLLCDGKLVDMKIESGAQLRDYLLKTL